MMKLKKTKNSNLFLWNLFFPNMKILYEKNWIDQKKLEKINMYVFFLLLDVFYKFYSVL